jgi:hypothetical protein
VKANTEEYLELMEGLAGAFAARSKMLEQRIDAAIVHIDRARDWVDASCACEGDIYTELVAAVDVLRGEATA